MSKQPTGSKPVCSSPNHEQLDQCVHILRKIVNTQDANMLPSRHQSLLSDLSLDSLSACGDSWQEVTIRLKIMPVLIRAVARVMYLISTGAGPASLMDGSTAGELLKTLSYDLLELLRRFKITATSSNTADRSPEGRWSQILALGAHCSDNNIADFHHPWQLLLCCTAGDGYCTVAGSLPPCRL